MINKQNKKLELDNILTNMSTNESYNNFISNFKDLLRGYTFFF